jgi:Arc/MetJ-type ribon-helix-helix transcriptional regulator
MEVRLTEDQDAFVRAALEAGRIARPEDAAVEAMALWEARERRRAELLADIDAADASLARGEGSFVAGAGATTAFAEDIKRRGRARLAVEAARQS